MEIVSTNIAKPSTFIWNGKEVTTGIYKTPTNKPIYLGKTEVRGDEVSDRKVHGGKFKACYLFSVNHYKYWQNLYPDLNWEYGMFGENLTVKGLDETQLFIGDVYKIGNAKVRITQPREPCFKFAAKFGSLDVLQQFIDHGCPGTYVSVLEEGTVAVGDAFKRIESASNSVSVSQFFKLLFIRDKPQDLLKKIVELEALPIQKRIKLAVFIKNG